MTDVLIAGGAVMGASVAFWLTRLDPALSITVVEPDPSYATAATALSAAGIRSQFTNPVNVAISRFGIDFIRDFARHVGPEGGVPDLGLRENGYLFLARTPEGAATLAEAAAMQRSLGAATEVLDRDALSARFPWMRFDDVLAGTFGPRDEGFFDNMGLLNGLKAAGRAAGVRWLRDRVSGFMRDGDRVTGATLAQGGTIPAQVVVNCAGPRAAGLMASLGLTLPVEARKRTVFVVDAPDARHPEAPLIVDPSGIWFRPEHGQWLAATVPSEDGPCAEDDFTPAAHLFDEVVWPSLYDRAEGFDACKVVRLWTGHYDYNTLDQNAIVGRHPQVANLYLANGFSGHGLQQAPAVGRGIAEQIVHGGWRTLDLSALGMERVLAGRLHAEAAIV